MGLTRGQEWAQWAVVPHLQKAQTNESVHVGRTHSPADLYLGVTCRSLMEKQGKVTQLSGDKPPLSAQREVYPAEVHLPVAVKYRNFPPLIKAEALNPQ